MRSSTSVFATNGDRNELLILSIGLSALQSVRRYNELQTYPFKAIYVGYLHRLKRFRAFASYQQPKQIESCTIKTAISISISVFCIFLLGDSFHFIHFFSLVRLCSTMLVWLVAGCCCAPRVLCHTRELNKNKWEKTSRSIFCFAKNQQNSQMESKSEYIFRSDLCRWFRVSVLLLQFCCMNVPHRVDVNKLKFLCNSHMKENARIKWL